MTDDNSYQLVLDGLHYEEARYLYALATGNNVEELHGSPGMSWSGNARLGPLTITRIGITAQPANFYGRDI